MLRITATLLLAVPTVAADPPPVAVSADVEIFFEAKLLVRQRSWGRRVEVDQWAGGKLRMRRAGNSAGTVRYEIAEVLESPWTFRWYPTRDEVKLGAALHVARPSGDAYSGLSAVLEPLAVEKYDLWWDSDPTTSGPAWQEENGRFWSRRHDEELVEKDPLPEHSTYPFHVLGPLDGRFAFSVRDGGVLDLVEEITSTWLTDGWQRARDGESVTGYGFWEPQRPGWEPRTYESLAAALALLTSTDRDPDVDPVARLADVLAALQPRAARVCRGWRSSETIVRPREENGLRVIEAHGSVDRRDLDFRWWRRSGAGADEFQILVDDRGAEALKFWVRVGYRPLDEGSVSGKPATKRRISSRTRR